MLNLEIFNVFGSDPDDLHLLVHLNEDPDDWETYSSAVVRLTGARLTVVHRIDEWIQSMWRSEAGGTYLVSVDGNVHADVGNGWQVVALGRRHSLNHVFGLADDSAFFCCGSNAGVFRGVGTQWQPMSAGLPPGADVVGLGGNSLHSLHALAKKGVIYRFDGERWVDVPSPTNQFLVGMLPRSDEELYFYGWKGSAFHKRGPTWRTLAAPADINFYSAAWYEGRVWLAASGDGIYCVADDQVVAVEPGIPAGGLKTVGNSLVAHFGPTLHKLTQGAWTSTKPDFSELTG